LTQRLHLRALFVEHFLHGHLLAGIQVQQYGQSFDVGTAMRPRRLRDRHTGSQAEQGGCDYTKFHKYLQHLGGVAER
jgi:hypothetical protein